MTCATFTKLGIVLGLLMLGMLTGCGGSGSQAASVSPPPATTAATTPSTTGASNLTPVAAPLTAARVRGCLKALPGALVQPVTVLNEGVKAAFATMPNGTQVGVAMVSNAAVARLLAKGFAAKAGYSVSTANGGKTVVIVKGTSDPDDLNSVADCVKP